MSDLANSDRSVSLALNSAREAMKHPLRLVPQAVRPCVFQLWMCHKHKTGCEDELLITGPLAIWFSRFGLRPEDAIEIIEGMMAPDVHCRMTFASDLTNELAKAVDLKLKQRKHEAAVEQRRREAREAEEKAVPMPKEIRDVLTGVAGDVKTRTAADFEAAKRSEQFARMVRESQGAA